MKWYKTLALSAAALSLAACTAPAGNTADPIQTPTQAVAAATPTPNPGFDPDLLPSQPTAVPTLMQTAAPTERPDPTPVAPSDIYPVVPFDASAISLNGLSESECDAYFSDAVFLGDSIMIGWRNYVLSEQNKSASFMGNTQFLVAGSYGAGHAVSALTAKDAVHPTYQGEKMQAQDAIAAMGAKKVFILFGLNDLAIYGVEGTITNFQTLIDRIKTESPDTQITIMSSTYMMEGSEKTKLNNANLRKLNTALIDWTNNQGIDFIDVASSMVDSRGYLKAEYSSDAYVHITPEGYALWTKILRGYAAGKLAG